MFSLQDSMKENEEWEEWLPTLFGMLKGVYRWRLPCVKTWLGGMGARATDAVLRTGDVRAAASLAWLIYAIGNAAVPKAARPLFQDPPPAGHPLAAMLRAEGVQRDWVLDKEVQAVLQTRHAFLQAMKRLLDNLDAYTHPYLCEKVSVNVCFHFALPAVVFFSLMVVVNGCCGVVFS